MSLIKILSPIIAFLVFGLIATQALLNAANRKNDLLAVQINTAQSKIEECQNAQAIDHRIDSAADGAVYEWMQQHGYITD